MASRREFVQAGSAALIGLSIKSDRPINGAFVNDSPQLGHQLRDHASFPAAQRVEKVQVVIVGGGVAGLSAAWRLNRRGFEDFVLLEMNGQAGGNSRWGENEITRYPWAAHYVPVPGPGATYVRELFEELGVLKDGQWEERYLCYAPQERLFLYGRWQEGIEPHRIDVCGSASAARRSDGGVPPRRQFTFRWREVWRPGRRSWTACRSPTGCAPRVWTRGSSTGT